MELFSLLAKLTLDTNEFSRDLDNAEKELNSIDAPEPKLELDNDDFNSGIEESQGLGDTFGTEMENVFKGIKTALTVTGIVSAIAGIVNGLKEAVNMTAETADGIDKGSKKLGISTKAYQEWDHALKQSGSGIDAVKKGIMNMQAAIKAADPATPFADAEDQVDGLADKTAGLSTDAYEALRDLGMLERLQAGEFKNAEELMSASLVALSKYVDEGHSTDERGIIVRKLFGRGGDELNALLDEGEEGVKALLTEASDLGLIMSDDEIKQAVAYGDAVENLNAELDAIRQAFVADIIPVLTDAVTWLTDFLTKLNPRLQTNSIFQIFDDINAKAVAATTKVDQATAEAEDLIAQLMNMGDYWTLDAEGKMTWDALAAKAIELFPELTKYIDLDKKSIYGNTQEINANIEAWARLQKERILAGAMEEKQKAVADQLTQAYEKGAEARLKEAEAEGKAAVSIDAMNEMLKNNADLRQAFYGKFGEGTEVTAENIHEALDWYLNDDDHYRVMGDEELTAYEKLLKEASSMRSEADKLREEAEKARDSLQEEQTALMQEMGFTEAEIKTVTGEVDEYTKKLNNIPRNVHTVLEVEEADWHPHAIGGTIPYDNYPALLHRGEKVLTATEARRGEGSGVDFTAMEDRIISAIRAGMDGVTVRSYLNGREITDEVSRQNIADVKARRFR